MLAKGGLSEGATAWAQGGIAAVLEAGDTFENHVRDTMVAGAGLNDREVVEFVIGEAPATIDRLRALGVPFNEQSGDLHLTREGGHSTVASSMYDATGWRCSNAASRFRSGPSEHHPAPRPELLDFITGHHQER